MQLADDAVAYAPAASCSGPVRLVLSLHGAGGSARHGLDLLLPIADACELLVVAAGSRQSTWDVLTGGFGPDVQRIDALLAEVGSRYDVSGVVVAGFSDGASYALSLGLTNGDLFDSVVAFSPGFAAPAERHGRPRVFVSHGDADVVLPIDRCSRRLVPALRRSGCDVTYEEFAGGHAVPPAVLDRAARWLVPP